MEQLERDRRLAASKAGKLRKRRKAPRTIRLRIRPGQQTWPFEGEYWLDEIGKFRSALRGACPVKKKGK